MGPAAFAAALQQTRQRTLDLVADLSDQQLDPEPGPTINPFRWELGHVAWFYDANIRRHHFGADLLLPGADEFFDSFEVEHGTRWYLEMPGREGVLAYMQRVQDQLLARLEAGVDGPLGYLLDLALRHEDMHAEAFLYMRQELGYGAPELAVEPAGRDGAYPGDVEVPAGRYRLGAESGGAGFCFDNEKWAHDVELPAFAIARAPVTQGEFLAFVEAGGYSDASLWSARAWRWREACGIDAPARWRRVDGVWQQDCFGELQPLQQHAPMIHVSWHEAQAWCRFAGRRLPSEAEWEVAASLDPATGRQARHPWGDAAAAPQLANLGMRSLALADVAAHPEGDAPLGCRQMLGNVWEWCECAFYPYPGYELDLPYREYSAPWFGDRKVLRGGAFATDPRLAYNQYRNFYPPGRRDVFAGFRTCALSNF